MSVAEGVGETVYGVPVEVGPSVAVARSVGVGTLVKVGLEVAVAGAVARGVLVELEVGLAVAVAWVVGEGFNGV